MFGFDFSILFKILGEFLSTPIQVLINSSLQIDI